MVRLPIPGSDSGNWGQILNDYLSQTHKSDGTLKDNIITPTNLTQEIQDKIDIVAGQQGATGPSGPIGPQGPTGASGTPGVPGAQGASGVQGFTGPSGPAGADGLQGLNGVTAVWQGTQSQYDALTPSSTVIYVITGA